MTVQAFNPSDLSQSAANWAVSQRIVGNFAPHAQVVPNLTLALDPGNLLNGTTLTEVNAQSVGPFAPPASGFRIDRVVVDRGTGAASIVTGTANSLTPPTIPVGKLPVARVMLLPTTDAVTNDAVVDERALTDLTAPIANQVICRAYLGADQAVAPSAGWTKINIGTIDINVGNGYDTANKRFLPSFAGYYQFNAGLAVSTVPAGGIIEIDLYKNGARYTAAASHSAIAGTVSGVVSDITYLNGTTDYLDVRLLHTSSQTLTVLGLSVCSWFSANRIG